jgi:hypothetical protein
MRSDMSDDPAGHYARLEVDPTASQEAIAAAYRRKARELHPDVAGTGNTDAFMRMKASYDVLSDAGRRAAYDRAAAGAAASSAADPAVAEPVVRGPRFSDLPIALWAGLGGVFCIAAMMAAVQLTRPLPPAPPPVARPFAPSVPPADPAIPASPPASAPVAGMTTHYVIPSSGPTVLWRRDAMRDVYLPASQLVAFSPVQALSLVQQHGLVEIRLADGGSGFVDAGRLTPGDGLAAHRAYCAYNAGLAPENGEVLARRGVGAARLEVANRSGQPTVVKLRDASGAAAVAVFVAPGATAIVTDLPDGSYRPEFAIGELWSRACHDFAAGMRAQQLAEYASPAALSPLVIPPDLSVSPAAVDIPDAAFERE